MTAKRVTLTVRSYSGKDAKKRVEYQGRLDVARKLEEYLNGRLDGTVETFMYYELARALGFTKEGVAAVLKQNQGGSNGITL